MEYVNVTSLAGFIDQIIDNGLTKEEVESRIGSSEFLRDQYMSMIQNGVVGNRIQFADLLIERANDVKEWRERA